MAKVYSTSRVQGNDLVCSASKPELFCDLLLTGKLKQLQDCWLCLSLELGLVWLGAAPKMLPDLSPQQLVPHLRRLRAGGGEWAPQLCPPGDGRCIHPWQVLSSCSSHMRDAPEGLAPPDSLISPARLSSSSSVGPSLLGFCLVLFSV